MTRALVALALTGCAGGMPLLHPAQVLERGEVRAVLGLSAQAAFGELASSIDAAASQPNAPTTPDSASGAMSMAVAAPGLAPVVGARVGVGGKFEGGIMYTGRSARVDLRRAFGSQAVALSIGLALDGTFYGVAAEQTIPGLDLSSLFGFGGEIPVLVGYRSPGGLYYLWAGVRTGFHHYSIATRSTEPRDPLETQKPLDGNAFNVGGLLGIAIGFNHIHVALECGVQYLNVSGTYDAQPASAGGVVVTPASAILLDF